MELADARTIKAEIKERSHEELVELCMRLSRFKKENKALITYELFLKDDEWAFCQETKEQITEDLSAITNKQVFWLKKSVRKVLKEVSLLLRFTKEPRIEIELLTHFALELNRIVPEVHRSRILKNLYVRQVNRIQKIQQKLPEDLRLDYQADLDALKARC